MTSQINSSKYLRANMQTRHYFLQGMGAAFPTYFKRSSCWIKPVTRVTASIWQNPLKLEPAIVFRLNPLWESWPCLHPSHCPTQCCTWSSVWSLITLPAQEILHLLSRIPSVLQVHCASHLLREGRDWHLFADILTLEDRGKSWQMCKTIKYPQ